MAYLKGFEEFVEKNVKDSALRNTVKYLLFQYSNRVIQTKEKEGRYEVSGD